MNVRRCFVVLLLLLTCSPFAAQEKPRRVISLAPNITEMIFKIGADDALVGRTDYCLYPPAARRIPSVGAYLNPDFEKMVSLEPDIVFLLPNAELEQKLHGIGLRPFTLPNETVEEIFFGLRALGRVLGRSERAESVIEGINDTLQWVRQQAAGIDTATALLLVGREAGTLKGLYAAGKNTYLGEILQICGGRNIFADVDQRYFDISKEALIRRDPDMILEFRILSRQTGPEQLSKLIDDWSVLPVLTAVQKNHIFFLAERYYLIPGPRISKVAMSLLEIMQKVSE